METPAPDGAPRPLVPPEIRNALASGIVLGLVAAAVVWWLERFETRRVMREMVGEAETYLRNHADFQAFLHERGDKAGE